MQTKKGSLFETCCNVFSGLITAYFTWIWIVIPMSTNYNWDMNDLVITQIFAINLIFTAISIARGHFWRRAFNELERRGIVK